MHPAIWPAIACAAPNLAFAFRHCCSGRPSCHSCSGDLHAGCHVLSEKPMAETHGRGTRSRSSRRAPPGASMPSCRTGDISRKFAAYAGLIQSGAIGEVTSLHCDFFSRSPFWWLPRGNASRPVSRHGNPYFRRSTLSCRCTPPMRSMRANGSPAIPGTAQGSSRCRHLRILQWSRFHLSRQLVRRWHAHKLGKWHGASSAAKDRLSGMDMMTYGPKPSPPAETACFPG